MNRLAELTLAVFAGEQPKVCQAYSDYEREPLHFTNAQQLNDHMLVGHGTRKFVDFAFWYPSCGGRMETRRIELKPEKCEGHTFRYVIEGWGIFHLQCDLTRKPAIECRISVNSYSRAKKWEQTYPELTPVHEWNWPAIERHERRLLRKLRLLSKEI